MKPKKSTEIARKHLATLNVDRNSGDQYIQTSVKHLTPVSSGQDREMTAERCHG